MNDAFKIALFLCIAPLAGCGSNARLIKQHEDELTARLANIDAAVKKIDSLPPLEETTLRYEGPKLIMQQDGAERFDVGVITLDAWNNQQGEDWRNAWWRTVRSSVSDPDCRDAYSREQLSRSVDQFLKARYALVIKKIAGSDPVLKESELESLVSFTPGVFSGEAHLVDLETGESLGGYRFFATNSDGPVLFGDTQSALDEDFKYEIMQAAEIRLFGLLGELDFENAAQVSAAQAALMGIWHAPEKTDDGRLFRLRVTAERIYFEAARNDQTLSGPLSLPLDISGKYHLVPGEASAIEFVDFRDDTWRGTYTIRGDHLDIDITPPDTDSSEIDVALRTVFIKTQYQRPYGE